MLFCIWPNSCCVAPWKLSTDYIADKEESPPAAETLFEGIRSLEEIVDGSADVSAEIDMNPAFTSV